MGDAKEVLDAIRTILIEEKNITKAVDVIDKHFSSSSSSPMGKRPIKRTTKFPNVPRECRPICTIAGDIIEGTLRYTVDIRVFDPLETKDYEKMLFPLTDVANTFDLSETARTKSANALEIGLHKGRIHAQKRTDARAFSTFVALTWTGVEALLTGPTYKPLGGVAVIDWLRNKLILRYARPMCCRCDAYWYL